ncbi:Hypothetical_protein [Hexamita inflata]|uniref:Hypothetical_protein n=1 Tax=Hexamita inflata TaxID=28002 RepID=A0AA86U6B4_9EUKA|nr:Hypothetical protein HINF_LOCUS32175 [Hexamita inflata]
MVSKHELPFGSMHVKFKSPTLNLDSVDVQFTGIGAIVANTEITIIGWSDIGRIIINIGGQDIQYKSEAITKPLSTNPLYHVNLKSNLVFQHYLSTDIVQTQIIQ